MNSIFFIVSFRKYDLNNEGNQMKILVLCGDAWHPPEIPRKGLEALVGMEFTFDYIEDARDWSPETLATYRLVILTKSDNVSVTDKTKWMTDPIQSAFFNYVQQGNGLLAIHSGTAEYEQKPVIRGLLGGVFLDHPEQCPVTVYPHPSHPLCTGVVSFTLKDEHYFMALDDSQADVFMYTSSVNGEQPGGWRREVGKGRVAVLTPGHNIEVWLHPSYQALLGNVLRWCGKVL
jgi:type 1 glutamine amidotransferase